MLLGGRRQGMDMKLHLYELAGGGFFVEEDETYLLLAHDPNAPVTWGFTEDSDVAHVFATADEARTIGNQWGEIAN